MIIKNCDRCGTLIRGTGIPRMTVTEGARILPGLNRQLCRCCLESLQQWVKEYEDTRTKNQRQG